MKRILLAGATGTLGSALLPRLVVAGYDVVALTRRASMRKTLEGRGAHCVVADATVEGALDGALAGIDVVVSAAGASVAAQLGGRSSYGVVDVKANRALAGEALRAGVPRVVYVSVHPGEGYADTAYVRAHLLVERELEQAGLSYTAIRPTGLFTAFEPFVSMARLGVLPMIGDGSARTNPIHPADVADAIVDHLEEGPTALSLGGPEVFTRREILEQACRARGRRPRVVPVPSLIPRAFSKAMRIAHPRLGDLVEFVATVSTHDGIAPAAGSHTLSQFFAELAARRRQLTA